MYGGAAGGGKSDALLMGALQFVHVPGYAALLLRKTFTDLAQPGALMDRTKTWLGPHQMGDVREMTQRHAWRFTCRAPDRISHDGQVRVQGDRVGHSVIQFGFLDSEKDKYRYQSAEFQYVGFDELTQFSESQYRYLFTRIRRPKNAGAGHPLSRVPLRMRSATNPGGAGHEWVRRRFIDSSHPERRFHAAKLADNPHIDQEEYTAGLMMLDPVTRAQMLEGDWAMREKGGYFDRLWFQDIVDVPLLATKRVRFWDLASSEEDVAKGTDPDWTAGALVSLLPNGRLQIENVTRFRKKPHDVEETIKAVAMADPPNTEVWIEQEPGASGKAQVSYYRRHVLPQHAVKGLPKTKDKITMASPVSARAQAGDITLVRGSWISDFMDEAELFPEGGHDDQVDAVTGAFHVLTGGKRARLIA